MYFHSRAIRVDQAIDPAPDESCGAPFLQFLQVNGIFVALNRVERFA